MKSYLRYLYYRYFFYYDPTKAWLKHTLKAILATFLATWLAIYFDNILAIWLVIPTMLMMTMVDISLALWQRLKIMVIQTALTMVAVSVITMTLAVWAWGVYFILCLFSFIALYFGSKQTLYLRTSTLFIIYLILALAKPVPLVHLGLVNLYILLGTGIALLIMLTIWPLTLRQQITCLLHTTTYILGRYISIILNDSIRGNYAINSRQLIREKLLGQFSILKKLMVTYQLKHDDNRLEQIITELTISIHQTIALQNILENLTPQSFLYAPLNGLQTYSVELFSLFSKKNTVSTEVLPAALNKLKTIWNAEKAVLKSTDAPYLQNLIHWEQVVYALEQLQPTLISLLSIKEVRS